MTHAVVVEFANAQDRDYYAKEDPAHKEYAKFANQHVEKVEVLDYEDDIFV